MPSCDNALKHVTNVVTKLSLLVCEMHLGLLLFGHTARCAASHQFEDVCSVNCVLRAIVLAVSIDRYANIVSTGLP